MEGYAFELMITMHIRKLSSHSTQLIALYLSIFWAGLGSGWAEKPYYFGLRKSYQRPPQWTCRASNFGPGLGGPPMRFVV
jgi:hypothetical protein